MEAACQYDLRLKYALGLGIDERPFGQLNIAMRAIAGCYRRVEFLGQPCWGVALQNRCR